jgi:hypothetical protein
VQALRGTRELQFFGDGDVPGEQVCDEIGETISISKSIILVLDASYR